MSPAYAIFVTSGGRQGTSDVRISIEDGCGTAAERSALQRGCGAVRRAVCAQWRWLRPVLLGLAGWHVAMQAWRLLQDSLAACRSGGWRAALGCALRQPFCCYCVSACPACSAAFYEGMQFCCRKRCCTTASWPPAHCRDSCGNWLTGFAEHWLGGGGGVFRALLRHHQDACVQRRCVVHRAESTIAAAAGRACSSTSSSTGW